MQYTLFMVTGTTAATGTISTPSGYTNIAQVHNEPQASSYKVITSAGATGAKLIQIQRLALA